MKTLSKQLSEFSFVSRESRNGVTLSNKCGRDFLYFALNFYLPHKFYVQGVCPVEIERQKLFGQPVPKWLAWTHIQFFNMPAYLATQGLKLSINTKVVSSFHSLLSRNLFSGFKVTYMDAINAIQNCIDTNVACGIDIPVRKGFFVLQDHVMFVYGYDEDNLYVFDTLTVKGFGYEKVPGEIGLYRLPKSLIQNNWSKFGRFWEVVK